MLLVEFNLLAKGLQHHTRNLGEATKTAVRIANNATQTLIKAKMSCREQMVL
jgi:hypothetical protein